MTGVAPSLALLGFFDVPSFGDLLIPRIVEHEVLRRCPLASVCAYAPLGRAHPVPLDGGHLAEPLGAATPERLAGIVHDHDLVLLAGTGDRVGPFDLGLYRRAADGIPRSGLADSFAGGPGPEAPDRDRVVRLTDGAGQDAVLLVDRICPEARRERRLMHLQAIGRWPAAPAVAPVVIDTDALAPGAATAATVSVLSELIRESPGRSLVAVDHQERPEPAPLTRLPRQVAEQLLFRVPALNLDDIAAAVSGAGLVVAASVPIALAAESFGVPSVLIRPSAPAVIDGFARRAGLEPAVIADAAGAWTAVTVARSITQRDLRVAARRRRAGDLDSYFDGLVELTIASWERRIARTGARRLLDLAARLHAESASLRAAHEARGVQLAAAKARLHE